ncbi:MAG: RluA family pseudouridine synthase [Saprospiraceae bacterium]
MQPQEEKIGDWVLYKNNQLIAFNKPAGLPVQADKTGDKSLLQLAEIYCKSKLYLIHRLDRPASGVVLFAKTKGAVSSLSDQFRERKVSKTYLAVVKEMPTEKWGVAKHFILKNGKQNRSYATAGDEEHGGKASEMKYSLLGSIDNYHLLEVQPLTGRHHQIRVQLSAMGSPIKGDVKYGFRRSNRDRSIHLHAWKLTFRHPVSGETVELKAAPPEEVIWDAFAAGGALAS